VSSSPSLNEEFNKIVGHSFWVKRFQKWYDNQPHKNVVLPDVRFPQEVDVIKSMGGIMIRVHRESVVPKIISHPSEDVNSLSGIDISVQNNGTINELWDNTEYALKYIRSLSGE
jgi:hypothetical protein